MACDADLVRVLLDAEGCVLDVGRSERLVTAAIWTALVARDRHCAFPGCTRPPVMGHAHHIRHWADGGPTSLDNLVLLCGHHHRTIHHTPWQVRLADDPSSDHPPRPGDPHHSGSGTDPGGSDRADLPLVQLPIHAAATAWLRGARASSPVAASEVEE